MENKEKMPGLRGRVCGMTALSGVCVRAFPFRGCRAAAVWGGATVDRQAIAGKEQGFLRGLGPALGFVAGKGQERYVGSRRPA